MPITESQQQKENRKKNKQIFRDPWNCNKRAKVHVIRVSEKEERKSCWTSILKSSRIWEANKILINLWIKEAEETPNRINQRYPCQDHKNQTSQN